MSVNPVLKKCNTSQDRTDKNQYRSDHNKKHGNVVVQCTSLVGQTFHHIVVVMSGCNDSDGMSMVVISLHKRFCCIPSSISFDKIEWLKRLNPPWLVSVQIFILLGGREQVRQANQGHGCQRIQDNTNRGYHHHNFPVLVGSVTKEVNVWNKSSKNCDNKNQNHPNVGSPHKAPK